jgi:hypothetical protein
MRWSYISLNCKLLLLVTVVISTGIYAKLLFSESTLQVVDGNSMLPLKEQIFLTSILLLLPVQGNEQLT